MNRKRKQDSFSDLNCQKRQKTNKLTPMSMEAEEGHNSIEYYIKGERLDTTDTRIIKSYNHVYFYSLITRKSAADLIAILLNSEIGVFCE